MIAVCGLNCEGCPIHLATLVQDASLKKKMKESIAEELSRQYDLNIEPENINDCDGCMAASGMLFSGCSRCEIRKCAGDRMIISCALCSEYACDLLRKHLQMEPGAWDRLEDIRMKAGTN